MELKPKYHLITPAYWIYGVATDELDELLRLLSELRMRGANYFACDHSRYFALLRITSPFSPISRTVENSRKLLRYFGPGVTHQITLKVAVSSNLPHLTPTTSP